MADVLEREKTADSTSDRESIDYTDQRLSSGSNMNISFSNSLSSGQNRIPREVRFDHESDFLNSSRFLRSSDLDANLQQLSKFRNDEESSLRQHVVSDNSHVHWKNDMHIQMHNDVQNIHFENPTPMSDFADSRKSKSNDQGYLAEELLMLERQKNRVLEVALSRLMEEREDFLCFSDQMVCYFRRQRLLVSSSPPRSFFA